MSHIDCYLLGAADEKRRKKNIVQALIDFCYSRLFISRILSPRQPQCDFQRFSAAERPLPRGLHQFRVASLPALRARSGVAADGDGARRERYRPLHRNVHVGAGRRYVPANNNKFLIA